MFIALKRWLFSLGLLAWSLQVSLALVPSGDFSLGFTNEFLQLWDLSGTFLLEQQITGPGLEGTPLSFSIPLSADARGRVSGAGTVAISIGNDIVAGDFTAVGRVSASHGITRMFLVVRFVGEDTIAGVSTPFHFVVAYKLVLS